MRVSAVPALLPVAEVMFERSWRDLQNIESFLESNDMNDHDELLHEESLSLEFTKKGFLHLLNEFLHHWSK